MTLLEDIQQDSRNGGPSKSQLQMRQINTLPQTEGPMLTTLGNGVLSWKCYNFITFFNFRERL